MFNFSREARFNLRQMNYDTASLWKTPCKFIDDERSLVAAISSGKCVVDELLHPP